MNIGGLALLFLVLVGAIFGTILIASKTNTTPYQDSYGNYSGDSTNETLGVIQNGTAVGTQVGSGAVLFVGVIILLVILVALGLVVSKKL
jgi:hypothetical protein